MVCLYRFKNRYLIFITFCHLGSDVTALYYSFSFDPKPDWSTLFPLRAEIWQYVDDLITKYNLRERMTFRTEVESAVWDENRKLWRVFLRDKQTGVEYAHDCRILFHGGGVLVDPNYPNIPGMQDFKGDAFHTARWKEDVDVKGKNVVVIGNGCESCNNYIRALFFTSLRF